MTDPVIAWLMLISCSKEKKSFLLKQYFVDQVINIDLQIFITGRKLMSIGFCFGWIEPFEFLPGIGNAMMLAFITSPP